MGSWKVTWAAAEAAADELIIGLEVPVPPRSSACPLPSGGTLRLSPTALPYTGNLSAGRVGTAGCWGRGPPSTGDRALPPMLPRAAEGDGFC